jgi:hypothetical protein
MTTVPDVTTVQVRNPLGFPPKIAARPMAPRLDSLDGRRVFVVDPRFDDGTNLLMEVIAWLEEHLPDVAVEYVPLPGNYLNDFSEVWEDLRARGDAAILGVGHCSTCAPAVAQFAMTLESAYGLPTVSLHTRTFARVVRSVCNVGGMPGIRRVFVPHPVIGRDAGELRAYLEGDDPLTGEPVLQELLAGLTEPLAGDEHEGVGFERSTPRNVEPDTEDRLQAHFHAQGWTDQLPIVLPTDERVTAMLAGTSRDRDEIVGRMRATHTREAWEFTVEKVAVNAVMAGARPEYLPVILALAAGGVSARGSSTASMNNMVVVNGPIREEVGMNSGVGAMGPYNHANATIGRAYGLLSQNLQGGSEPGLSYMGSQGNGLAYNSLCFAENEEASPWEGFHTDHGFGAADSTVSVFRGGAYMSATLAVRPDSWQEHLRSMVLGMDPGMCAPTVLLDPLAAEQFMRLGGFATKKDLAEWIRVNVREAASVYWDRQIVRNYILPNATAGKEPAASRLRSGSGDDPIELFEPGAIGVVVVGGATKPYWCVAGPRYQTTVSVDAWR